MTDESTRYVLVTLRSTVGNCMLFWAEGKSGYTCDLSKAHVFGEDEAFRQHQCRPEVDYPIPLDVAQALVVQHVRQDAVFDWCRDNQDEGRADPYGARPAKKRRGDRGQ